MSFHRSLIAKSIAALGLVCGGAAVSRAAGEKPAPTPTGEKPGLIPRNVLFGNPDKAAPELSPDGKYLAYLAPVEGVLNVWVGPADDPAKAKPVTADKKRGIRNYFWAYTGEHILYIQDADGDENWHVYSVHVPTGETKDLTPLKGVRADVEAVSHKFPTELLVGLNDRDPRHHDIYRVNLATGERELVQKNPEFAGFVTDDDFRVRFASKITPDGGNAILKPDGKGGWEDFLKIPMEDTLTTRPLLFDKTGKTLYLMDSRGRDTGALVALDTETGGQKVLASDPKADVGSVFVHPRDNTIQGVAFVYDRMKYEFFDKAVEEDFARLRKVAAGDITIASRTLDDGKWVVAFLMD
ncbi:MAG TPA: S9 family peptidase, partial [Gemmataceae bacterium]